MYNLQGLLGPEVNAKGFMIAPVLEQPVGSAKTERKREKDTKSADVPDAKKVKYDRPEKQAVRAYINSTTHGQEDDSQESVKPARIDEDEQIPSQEKENVNVEEQVTAYIKSHYTEEDLEKFLTGSDDSAG